MTWAMSQIAGCTCHAENPDNSITVILDDVPYRYSAGTIYQMAIQLIGGPEIDTESNTAGFSMRVSAGTLSGAEGFEDLVQNWEGRYCNTNTCRIWK